MLLTLERQLHDRPRANVQTILVVEDDEINLELTADLLESVGYEVAKAQNAEQGLELARETLPDLILMDLGLPKMDGLTATKLLKEDSRTSRIPVVALTAHAMKGDEVNAYSAGCEGYLSKPFGTRSFLGAVATFLENRNNCEAHTK